MKHDPPTSGQEIKLEDNFLNEPFIKNKQYLDEEADDWNLNI